jgi:hypothetical protein
VTIGSGVPNTDEIEGGTATTNDLTIIDGGTAYTSDSTEIDGGIA